MPAVNVGIDPGRQGGIAVLIGDAAEVWDLPYDGALVDVIAVRRLLHQLGYQGPVRVIIEEQRGMPVFRKMRGGKPVLGPDGKPEMMRPGAASTFRTGQNYGALVTVARLTGAEVLTPQPKDWKAGVGVSASKASSMARALELFPGLREDLYTKRGRALDGRAEALLLAEFGRRIRAISPPSRLA